MGLVEVIIGPPGTGKSTTVATMVQEHVSDSDIFGRPEGSTPAVVCSLTRAAASEIASERRGVPLPPWAIGTLHALAFRALGCPDLVEKHIAAWNADHPVHALSGGDASGGARGDLDDPQWDARRGESAPGDRDREQLDLLRARQVPRESWPDHVRRFGDLWSAWKRDLDLLDFTDLIAQARAVTEHAPGRPTAIFADEAQDLSSLELDLLRHWALAAGRLVLVGDPQQAVYVWRGAHPEMFHSDRIDPEHRSVLSQSYRVPSDVHAAACRWVRQLSDWSPAEYRPKAGDPGEARRCRLGWTDPGGKGLLEWVEERLAGGGTGGGTGMIQASCGYMLGPTLAALRGAGVPFANPWRRKRGDWNPLGGGNGVSMGDRLLCLLRPTRERGMWTWTELHAICDPLEAAGCLETGAKSAVKAKSKEEAESPVARPSIVDLYDVFGESRTEWLLSACDAGDGGTSLIDWWREHLLKSRAKTVEYPLRVLRRRGWQALSTPPRIYVGTMHSFKGAEADDVLIYPDLSDAGRDAWDACGRSRDEVIRLGYVAMTRARRSVSIGMPSGSNSMPLDRFLGE